MVHCRSFSASELRIPEGLSSETRELDPITILGEIPETLLAMSTDLVIQLWDDENMVLYTYDSFMMKTYALRSGYVHFGAVALQLNRMSMIIGLRFYCLDVDELAEPLD